jgi:hypothetical protein
VVDWKVKYNLGSKMKMKKLIVLNFLLSLTCLVLFGLVVSGIIQIKNKTSVSKWKTELCSQSQILNLKTRILATGSGGTTLTPEILNDPCFPPEIKVLYERWQVYSKEIDRVEKEFDEKYKSDPSKYGNSQERADTMSEVRARLAAENEDYKNDKSGNLPVFNNLREAIKQFLAQDL